MIGEKPFRKTFLEALYLGKNISVKISNEFFSKENIYEEAISEEFVHAKDFLMRIFLRRIFLF